MTIKLEVVTNPRIKGISEKNWRAFMRGGIRRALKLAGDASKPMLKSRAFRNDSVWKNRFASGWYYKITTTDDATVLTFDNKAKHAVFIERGRRPNLRPPPTSAIAEWVRDKLGPNVSPYAVAKSIGKKGIKPKPVLLAKDMQAEITALIIYAISRQINRVAREL